MEEEKNKIISTFMFYKSKASVCLSVLRFRRTESSSSPHRLVLN